MEEPMLSKEDNELLCRVGRGTPMGELMRQYWIPALPSSEFAEPDGAPKRMRLLGENLVMFRDTKGRMGAMAELLSQGLGATGELAAFVERGVTAGRRRHQEAIALAEDALDVVGIDMGMAYGNIVLLAGPDYLSHRLEHRSMIVLTRMA
jgi:hypothetical protein